MSLSTADVKPSIYEKWLSAFKTILESQGWGAQSRIAEKVGKTVKHISDIKVERKRASLELQENIAIALGYTFQEMVALHDPIIKSEPFPQYNDIMRLPIAPRGWEILRIAAEQYHVAEFLSFSDKNHGNEDPEIIDRFLKGEFNEEDFYKEACRFFVEMKERMKDEFAKRGF